MYNYIYQLVDLSKYSRPYTIVTPFTHLDSRSRPSEPRPHRNRLSTHKTSVHRAYYQEKAV